MPPRRGRPRDFDLERATDRAVRVFWRQGYAATSVRDLCAAMGIESGSFYAAFGSKQACFRAALARYAATQPVPRTPSPQAIRAWFDVIVDPARRPRGCLLVDSAVELPGLDRASQTAVRAALAAVDDFFTRCLAGRGRAARADAALLAAAVTAIHVMARAGVPALRLRALADRALAAACIS
jgi:TetR/AcrR family transcriptional repressor of nem operon